MILLNEKQVQNILNNNGASLDFKTLDNTSKQGYFISQYNTESVIKNINKLSIKELTKQVNKQLQKDIYNQDQNKNNILGFWIHDNVLYIDVSKCLKANDRHIGVIKKEAFNNKQYSVYNNITNKTYSLVIPVYTLYNTKDLLQTIEASNINNYSLDFYSYDEIKSYLGFSSDGSITDLIFNSVDDIPEDYNFSKVIIKDTTNYTRDILEDNINLSLEDAYNLSKLIIQD